MSAGNVNNLNFNLGNVLTGSPRKRIVQEQIVNLPDGRQARLVTVSDGKRIVLPIK